jgi:hypothetical protein
VLLSSLDSTWRFAKVGLGSENLYMQAPRSKSRRNARLGWVVLYALAATAGCRSSFPDWNGAWKLNSSESKFQGPIFTISISTDGEYRYDDDNSSFTFRCDGRYRPIAKNRTQACVTSSATVLDMTRKENGTKTNTYHWELSAGGKVFTSTATAFRPNGPVITAQVASRMSGSNDFAGQWRDTSYRQRHADMTLRLDGPLPDFGFHGQAVHQFTSVRKNARYLTLGKLATAEICTEHP